MSSDAIPPADVALETLLQRLGESHLYQTIDARLLGAARQFPRKPRAVRSSAAFHRAIGQFIQHLYEHGLRLSQRLTPAQARGTAVELLRTGYGRSAGGGYAAALDDATQPGPHAIDSVLAGLGEALRQRERAKYRRSVIARSFEVLAWDDQCAVVRLLVQRYGAILPKPVRHCPPARLVDEVPALIDRILAVDQTLRHAATEAYAQGGQ